MRGLFDLCVDDESDNDEDENDESISREQSQQISLQITMLKMLNWKQNSNN